MMRWAFGDDSVKKTKILMYQTHVAYIDRDLIQAFDELVGVPNFSAWIRKQARLDFDLEITSAYGLSLLDEKVRECYYSDKTEWLREKMRNAITMTQNKE